MPTRFLNIVGTKLELLGLAQPSDLPAGAVARSDLEERECVSVISYRKTVVKGREREVESGYYLTHQLKARFGVHRTAN